MKTFITWITKVNSYWKKATPKHSRRNCIYVLSLLLLLLFQ